ncbi:MAG: toll/interleukin-1 receptor domain-containing protein [Eubacteriaceae bacterium]
MENMNLSELKFQLNNEFSKYLKIEKEYKLTFINNKKIENSILSTKIFYLVEIDNFDENYKHLGIVIENLGIEYKNFHELIYPFLEENINSVFVETKEHYNDFEYEGNTNANLQFTNNIYIFCNNITVDKKEIIDFYKQRKIKVIFRDNFYRNRIKDRNIPDIFICHDSRDKDSFVKPLYNILIKKFINVWYDEYSLDPGDSLTERIEKGIQSCRVCILVLSKNLLENKKWAKNELQALKTRQIVTDENIIIPIWLDIEEKQIASISYWLLDKVAIKSEEGLDTIANKIKRILQKKKLK